MAAVNIPGFMLLLFKVGIVANISICPETHPLPTFSYWYSSLTLWHYQSSYLTAHISYCPVSALHYCCDYPLLPVSLLFLAFLTASQAKLSKSGKEKLQLRLHSEPEQSPDTELTQVRRHHMSPGPGPHLVTSCDPEPGVWRAARWTRVWGGPEWPGGPHTPGGRGGGISRVRASESEWVEWVTTVLQVIWLADNLQHGRGPCRQGGWLHLCLGQGGRHWY